MNNLKRRAIDNAKAKIGRRQGRIEIADWLGFRPTHMGGPKRSLFLAKCDCGKEFEITYKSYESGTVSCGCVQKAAAAKAAATHKKSRSALYKVWTAMKQRCQNPKDKEFRNYGGRGIQVCDRWSNSFELFLDDMGPRQEGMEIDRINNDGDYTPDNCRWATRGEQSRNTRRTRIYTIGNVSMSIKDWSEREKIPYTTLKQRLDKGMSIEEAITTPVNKNLARR